MLIYKVKKKIITTTPTTEIGIVQLMKLNIFVQENVYKHNASLLDLSHTIVITQTDINTASEYRKSIIG